MATCHFTTYMMIDARNIVLEIRVNIKRRLNGASSHDHLLNLRFSTGGLNFAAEGILVISEVIVRGFCCSIACARTLG
jgi:hypothetical protein